MKGSSRRLIAALALSPVIALVPDAGANLISNADFSLGNVDFDTDYAFSPGALGPEGTYDLVTDPSDSHGLADSFGDHTSGDGLMLMINGATIPNQIVWSQQVNVTPGQDYVFSMWVASWFPLNPARLRVLINSVAIAPDFEPSSVTGTWTSFAATWNSGSDTVAIISIIDQETVGGGNDFVLDDLSFVLGSCGNGNLDPGEECDGVDDTACPGACLSDCTCPKPGFCNVLCDNGAAGSCPSDAPGCSTPQECLDNICRNPISCGCGSLTECTFNGVDILPPPVCGDGIREGAEECDPGVDPTGFGEEDCNCPDQCQANCTCPGEGVPTVSAWGLIVMALLLLAGAKVYFRQRPATG